MKQSLLTQNLGRTPSKLSMRSTLLKLNGLSVYLQIKFLRIDDGFSSRFPPDEGKININ